LSAAIRHRCWGGAGVSVGGPAPLVTRVGDSVAVVSEAVEDAVGGLVPDVGFRVVVPVGDSGPDRGDEIADRVVGGALDPLGGQFSEAALDEVEP
jgi:hypothetical protein